MDEVKSRRVRWKNVGIVLLIVFGGLYVLYPLTMNVMVWHLAREMSKDYPSIGFVPQQLQANDVANIKDGVIIQRFGYNFQFPARKVSKQQDFKEITAVHFEDGLVVLIMNHPSEMDLSSFKSDHRGTSAMKQMFTARELESHYNYAVAMMNAKPSDLSLLHSRVMNARTMMLLSMKALEVPRKPTAIFKIERPQMKGFQIGDPRSVPTDVTLKLYDSKDQQLEIHLRGQKDSTAPVLMQEQVNAIIASIHTVN